MKDCILMLEALGEETRAAMVELIGKHPKGISPGEIVKALALPQPSVSHHAGILSRAGLIVRHKAGRGALFTIHHDNIKRLAAEIAALIPGRSAKKKPAKPAPIVAPEGPEA
jgi:DNA-binding transcriptional ArsR family regulator